MNATSGTAAGRKVAVRPVVSVLIFVFLAGLAAIALAVTCALAQESVSVPQLSWLDGPDRQGDILLVDNRLLFNPGTGEFTALKGCGERYSCSLSRSGKMIVLHDPFGDIRYGPVIASSLPSEPFPRWISIETDDDTDKYMLLNIQTDFVWISDRTLLVNQRDVMTGETSCRTLSMIDGQWSEPLGACIDAAGLSQPAMEPLSDGLIAVYSGSEGTTHLEFLLAGDPEQGAAADITRWELPLPELFPGGVFAGFTEDGAKLHLNTRCTFSTPAGVHTCKAGQAGWHLYALDMLKGGAPELVATDLPQPVFVSPRNRWLYAWPVPGGICTGDPNGTAACRDLPG